MNLSDLVYLKYENRWRFRSSCLPWKGYYENGQLDFEGSFKNDKKKGLWKCFYKNGQLEQESDYLNPFNFFRHKKTCWDEDGNEIDCEE